MIYDIKEIIPLFSGQGVSLQKMEIVKSPEDVWWMRVVSVIYRRWRIHRNVILQSQCPSEGGGGGRKYFTNTQPRYDRNLISFIDASSLRGSSLIRKMIYILGKTTQLFAYSECRWGETIENKSRIDGEAFLKWNSSRRWSLLAHCSLWLCKLDFSSFMYLSGHSVWSWDSRPRKVAKECAKNK